MLDHWSSCGLFFEPCCPVFDPVVIGLEVDRTPVDGVCVDGRIGWDVKVQMYGYMTGLLLGCIPG